MRRSILLVDDEPGVLFALKYSLGRDGYKLVTAGDATQALELIDCRPFDLVVCDQFMPGMSGLELLFEAGRRRPQMLGVLITGAPDLEVALEAVRCGAICRYLTKPWDHTDLRTAIKSVFEQHHPATRAVLRQEQCHDAQ